MATAAGETAWGRHAGAWLAIGTSPGAIVLGAQLADRRAGPLPVLSLAFGGGLMVVLLLLQGRLGLLPPRGHGQPFSALSRLYLRGSSRRLVGLAITGGMVGWVGFSIGIGGESLARMTGLPHAGGALCLGAVVLVLVLAGVQRWNVVALFTTVATLVLAPLLLLSLDDVAVPVAASGTGAQDGVGELAAFVGYAAVFMLRAPDFTWGIARPSGVLRCVLLLVVPALLLVLVGAAMRLSVGDAAGDATLAGLPLLRVGGVPVGDLLIVLAVLAPAVTAAHSGGMALQIFTGVQARAGMAVLGLVGVLLGILEFQRELLPWLALLAGIVPPIAVPFWVEHARRRRGHEPRWVPWWTWLPASVVGGGLIARGSLEAPLASLGLAALLCAVWTSRLGQRADRTGVRPAPPGAPGGTVAPAQPAPRPARPAPRRRSPR